MPYKLFVIFLSFVALAFQGHAQTLAGTSYTNSWLGNTYGLPADHIPHTIDHIYVAPSGKVATITGWDEGGANAALYGPTGAKIGIPVESGTGSWGRNSGHAVFVDESYLYQSMSQDGGYDADGQKYPVDPATSWKCIRRYFHNGSSAPFTGGKGYDSSMLVVDSGTLDLLPTGVIVYANQLYVSDPISGTIKVYDATTMSATPVLSFSISNPGPLDYDRLGFIWMLDKVQKKLIRFSTSGVLQSQFIIFPAAVTPTSFCVDKINDRILVTNNGVAQNILIYTSIFGIPTQTATFGTTNGINSGTVGVIAPLKFSEPKGVGIDSSGNIIVGNNGVMQGGARLEKYNSAGVLQWRLNGLLFTDNGSLNPANEAEFYTKEFKFTLNLNNTSPGSEWSPAAMTLNKVKFPNDSRIPTVDDTFWTTAYTRNVVGKKLLYVSSMYGSSLAIYRFNSATDGETAIPSGMIESWSVETIWRDANGNGSNDAGETQSQTPHNLYCTHIFPDSNGGIWKVNRDHVTNKIRYFPLQGFDVHGNPQYSHASAVDYGSTEINDVKRLEYDAPNDVLYVAGWGSPDTADEWWVAGDRLVRYNFFTNAANRTTAWSIPLPFGSVSDFNVKAFCEAGDYLFLIAAKEGRIYVHEKSTGAKVGEILPTAATGSSSGWADINGAIRATKRANGEYLIFAEENGMGKIMMYRWTPYTSGVGGLVGFRQAFGLASDGSQDLAMPAGDSVPNLLKYAFNMMGSGGGKRYELTHPNSSNVTASGDAGLPLVGLDTNNRLTLTYIRRKASANPGVSYTAEYNANLAGAQWAISPTATESITSIDSSLERVMVTETATASPQRFVRIKVTAQ